MIQKVGKKRKERIQNGGSEVNVFKIVYERAKSHSELSGKYVSEAKTRCFAHILPKGTRPKLRLDPNNIIFVADIKEHEIVDSLVAGKKAIFFELVKNGKAIEKLQHDFLQPKKQNVEKKGVLCEDKA